MVQNLGQFKAHTPAHMADGSAADRLQHGRLAGLADHLLPVALILQKGLGSQILLLLLDMQGIVRRLGHFRSLSGQQLQIHLADLVAQHDLGPTVGNDMVQLHQHTAAGLAVPEQHKPVQGPIQQRDQLPGNGVFPVLNALAAGVGEVVHREILFGVGCVVLHHLAIPFRQPGAQGRVALQNQRDALLQQGEIQTACNADGGADVVDGGTRQRPFQI